MMSQNRQAQRDREHAEDDAVVNKQSKKEIEEIKRKLDSIDQDKLDKIIELLKNKDYVKEH